MTDVDLHAPVAREDFSTTAISDAAKPCSSSARAPRCPRPVRHTHRSIVHGTRHWVDCLRLGPNDHFQVATPPSHILGLLNLLAESCGRRHGPGAPIRPRRGLRRIEIERMTLEMAVAPIALAMANHPRLESDDLTSLRFILWGAQPVTPSGRHVTAGPVRWLRATEHRSPVIACNPVHRPKNGGSTPPGSRRPGSSCEWRTWTRAPSSRAIGEIHAWSPSLMAGYLPADATADAFVDGWYRTGDVGWLGTDGST